MTENQSYADIANRNTALIMLFFLVTSVVGWTDAQESSFDNNPRRSFLNATRRRTGIQ